MYTQLFLPRIGFIVALGLVLNVPSRGSAQEEEPLRQLWSQTQQLLQRREYSLAVNLLENRLDDPELFEHTKRIQHDLDAVQLLKKFSTTVQYAVEKLPESKPLSVLYKEYRFKRHLLGESGQLLVLSDDRGVEVTLPLRRIDSATWRQIAAAEVQSWHDKDLVLGLFFAFDRYPNARLARTHLNKAAESGRDVTIWIERLEAAEKSRKAKGRSDDRNIANEDLILGKWSVTIKKGPQLVWEFRRGGDGFVSLLGRHKRAKWEAESSGVYRFTDTSGISAIVNVSGDRIFGRLQNGRPFLGIRQAE